TTLVGLVLFIQDANTFHENARELSNFISSIRLSTLLVFCIALMGWMFLIRPHLLYFPRFVYVLIALWFFVFILLMKSMNGVFILAFVGWATCILYIFKAQKTSNKVLFFCVSIITPIIIVSLFISEYVHFYNYEKVDFNNLETTTVYGNPYLHENNGDVENGHYVRIYISDAELHKEWEKHSSIPYFDRRE